MTGTLGDSAAGLKILSQRATADEPKPDYGEASIGNNVSHNFSTLIARHNRPAPRLNEGRAAAEKASAMIDISDGFIADLGHICEMSGTGALIVPKKIPLSPALLSYCEPIGIDPLEPALFGGEDYELIITCDEDDAGSIMEAFKARGLESLTRVGTITKETEVRVEGRELDGRGYDHFRG